LSQKLGEPQPTTGKGKVAPDFDFRFGEIEATACSWGAVSTPF